MGPVIGRWHHREQEDMVYYLVILKLYQLIYPLMVQNENSRGDCGQFMIRA
jgi:hypothetical protein